MLRVCADTGNTFKVTAYLIGLEDKNTPGGFVFTEPSGVLVLLGITRARFRKVGFWLYQVHFSGFGVHKFRCFHCVFLSAQWIAVKLMSRVFDYLSSGSFRC